MKTKYYLPIILFLLSIGSCKKFLATKPTDFLNPTNYYQTEDQLNYARAGVYSILGAGALYGSYTNYLLAWDADVAYLNRSTLTAGPWNYNFSPADGYNNAFWVNLYNGINRANVLLANVDKNPELPQSLRDKIRGETLFLRGFYYFLLVQYYGEVPIKIVPTESALDVDIAKSSIKDVYAQILKDMTAAEPLVPGIKEVGFGGAISKSAVRGILARVCLTMAGSPLKDVSKYQDAKTWAKMVMDDAEAGHSLNPSYPQIFMNLSGDKYDIKESIWEVEFWGNRTDQYIETGNIGWINGPASLATSATGRADAYMNITAKYYNIFEPGDLRKWFTIAHFSYLNNSVNGSKSLSAIPTTEAAKYNYKPAKFRREYETLLPKSPTTTNENFPLLRYSDILLMFAEAENAINGPTADAIAAINKVRERAWSSGVATITVTNSGTGYTTIPTVTFSSGNGSNATAAATISGGKVTGIVLSRDLTGVTFYNEGKYSTPPTITITGGGGNGATATATIYDIHGGDVTPIEMASKESLLKFIQDERMREFAFEGLRKSDLLRWGIFLQVNQDMGNTLQLDVPGAYFIKNYANVSNMNLFMPIPINEISGNQKMVQNPGW